MQDALLVTASFRGCVIATKLLRSSARGDASAFHVGWKHGSDAPVASALAPAGRHALVRATPHGWAVDHTAAMVVTGDPRLPARIGCGEVTIALDRVAEPEPLARTRALDDRADWPAVVATLVVALWLAWLPPDAWTLSFDDLGARDRLLPMTLIPTQPAPTKSAATPLPSSRAATAATGAKSKLPRRRLAPRPTSSPARARAQPAGAPRGIVALIGAWRTSGAIGQVFAADHGLDEDTALEGLTAAPGDGGFGAGGLGPAGSGAGGGGEGAHTIGGGPLPTIGGCVGPRPCGGRSLTHGDALAALGPPTRHLPQVEPKTPHVAGSLDKELIRRVVRRHMNEVRYCYERELGRAPKLAGRVVVKFVVAPNGTVPTAAIESSTLADARVEACLTATVARWDFPTRTAGAGAGVAIVSYPFVFAVASGW